MYQIPEHVAERTFEGQTVLLDLNTGRYFELNPTGSTLLAAFASGATLAAAVDALVARFDVQPEVAERDAQELCSELLQRGLLIEREQQRA